MSTAPQPEDLPLFAESAKPVTRTVLSVSQVTALVKRAIRSAASSPLHVVGELSNFKAHSSGHRYFTLKDGSSELACVMWRSLAQGLTFDPADGMEVVATGELDVFDRAGKYQLYVRRLEPVGAGALDLAFRQLHRRLQREGLFDVERKRPLPRFPRHVAVATSSTGAALRDILQTLRRRFPCLRVSVCPVPVQGEQAAPEIARALDRLNAENARWGIDVIIVGRGGGSLEDLWAFNTEVVARAITRSAIPVVSAVGHEVDLTISDLVADVRAATPTAAAELVVPRRDEVLLQLHDRARRLHRAGSQRLAVLVQQLRALEQREPLRAPLRRTNQLTQGLDLLHGRISHGVARRLHHHRQALSESRSLLLSRAPREGLSRARQQVLRATHRLTVVCRDRLRNCDRRLVLCARHLTAPRPRLPLARQRLQYAQATLQHRLRAAVARRREALAALDQQLQSVDYRRTLSRGYTVTRHARTGKLVTAADDVAGGQRVRTETARGTFESTVTSADDTQQDRAPGHE